MLNFNSIEKQAGKKVHSFLLHMCTAENLDPANARIVINTQLDKAALHLFNDQHYVKTIPLKAITDFFGVDYHEEIVTKVNAYLVMLCEENSMRLGQINIVVCETKSELGVYLYADTKYKKRIPTLDLVNQFISNE